MKKNSNAMKNFILAQFFLLLCAAVAFPQSVIINEILTSNSTSITDEDGDNSDWIELYNRSDHEVNLKNFHLSDDKDDLFQWHFPELILEPAEFLLVFASGKDQAHFNNAIIKQGDIWKYRLGDEQPPFTWNTVGYKDDHWSDGQTGIGYGDDDDETKIPKGTPSVYARCVFHLDNTDDIEDLFLMLDYDDGFVAYMNGREFARANLTGTPPQFDEMASPDHEAKIYRGLTPEKFTVENFKDILVPGKNVLAVEVHNTSATSTDFSFIPYLIVVSENQPESLVSPAELNLPPAVLHTNFKLNTDGEILILSDSTGQIQDQVEWLNIPTDVSYGRKSDDIEDWAYFYQPTPGKFNTTKGYDMLIPEVTFNNPGGFYDMSVMVEMAADTGDFRIYYTTDGSSPSVNSTQYNGPIELTATTVLKACIITADSQPGKITTDTYLIDTHHDLPVISISSDPKNFWDNDSGIYVLGDSYESEYPYFGANFWEDWEREVHIEFFEIDRERAFAMDAGVKIFGGYSRALPMKSLAIFARGKYGDGKINHQLYPDLDIDEFENMVLRSSANDFDYTMLRDGFMQGLVEGTHIDVQGYRPAVVYLNGAYWGIHNIREKLNEHYVASHHNVDPDNIDLLESHGKANHGDAEEWWELYDFIENNDMQNSNNYEFVKAKIDIENFIEYYVAEIYFDNTDWPGNNIKYWKEKSNTGKWRWMLYDTDFGFGLYSNFGYNERKRYKHNTLAFALASNGPGWPNPPWSTLLLRKFMENHFFKRKFVNYFCDFLNTRFDPENVVFSLDEATAVIAMEMEAHINRWPAIGSVNKWQSNLAVMKQFGIYRAGYCFAHLNSTLDLGGTATINLKVEPADGGSIKLNHINISEPEWRGNYFKTIPIDLVAVPKPGYRFEKWEGDVISNEKEITDLRLTDNHTLSCRFSPYTPEEVPVVINEINYKSAADFDTGDWVELYNNSDATIDVSNWQFMDAQEDNWFVIPDGTIMAPESYLILAENSEDFKNFYPAIENIAGDFDFGLNRQEEIVRLYDLAGELVDSVKYTSSSPWPEAPNGSGATLILKSPGLDNLSAENWTASAPYGSPGHSNISTEITGQNEVVQKFVLHQNFPNPFNGETKICYHLAKAGQVKLSVFNLAGQKCEEIINKQQQPGVYNISYLPDDNLSSGIYFYRLRVDDRLINIRKMVYLK